MPERSLPGPRYSGVTGLGNTPCGACWIALLTDGCWRRVGTQQLVRPPGCSLWSPPGAERVVCARWCPTLPHPGGCSTIGAVRLSFRVRDGAGRFPVAVTTETTTWAVRQCVLVILLSGRLSTHTRACAWCVCGWSGWVGCGPYSGRFAFTVSLTPHRTWRVLGCCCLCWPISTSQLINRCRSSTSGLSTQ